MTTCTIVIKDGEDGIDFKGALDNPEALDLPPTPALIVATYISANLGTVAQQAIDWYNNQVVPGTSPDGAPVQDMPQIILPGTAL